MQVLINLVGVQTRLNEVKASGGCHRLLKEIYRASSIKSGRKFAEANLISIKIVFLKLLTSEQRRGF